ncbi:MAG: hypothetical protein QX197_15920 [Methylococcaceae bacterium]
MTKDEFKSLSDATYVALLDLKIAKWDKKSTRTLKGRFLSGQEYPTPYSEKELLVKKRMTEAEHRKCTLIFSELWKARRRAQQYNAELSRRTDESK